MFSRKITILIKDIDKEINDYAQIFDKEKKDIDSLTSNASYICNERTMSCFANEQINKYFNSSGFNTIMRANEFAIEFKNGINQVSFKKLKTEVEKSKQQNPWNRCFVDGYFKVKNLLGDENITHLFVEYKMDNSFVYLELGNDFLKYKAITYANESNTAFAYIIFDKNELYPSILSTHPHFSFIRKRITSQTVEGSKRVYIYLPIFQKGQENKSIDNLYSKIKQLNRASYFAEKVDEFKRAMITSISDEDLVFINSMKLFNSKVVKSMTLRKHYSFIKKLWDKCEETNFFDNPKNLFEGCETFNPTKIIEEGAKYRINLGRFITVDDREEVMKNGFHAILNVSLFIVSFLDFFDEKYAIGVKPPEYDSVKIRGRKKDEPFELSKTVEAFKEKFKKHYSLDNDSDKKTFVDYSVEQLAAATMLF